MSDLAVDAELKDYKKATEVSGGSKPLKSDKEFFDLERYTDTGDAYARTPEREQLRQDAEEEFDAAREKREQEKEEEYATLVPLLHAYGLTQTDKQRHAWELICYEPHLTGKEIAETSGVSTGKISNLRAWFAKLSERFFSLCEPLEDEGAPADLAPGAALDTALDVSEPEALGAAEVDKKGDAAALKGDTPEGWAQGLVHGHHAPDTEADVSENVMRGYQRMRKTANAHQAPHPRQYSDSALMRGSENRRATAEDQVFFEHKRQLRDAQNRPISDAATVAIRELAEKFGLDVQQLLQSATIRKSVSADGLLSDSISGPKPSG